MHDNFGGNNDAYGLIVTIQKAATRQRCPSPIKTSAARLFRRFCDIPACSEVQEPAII